MIEDPLQDYSSESDASAAVPSVIDDRGCVVQSLDCPRCRRDLRGIHIDEQCPGCGLGVMRIVHGDALRFSSPAWMYELVKGSRLILISIAVWIVCMVLFMIGMFVLAFNSGGAPPAPRDLLPATILLMVPQLMFLYSMWLMTTPDPDLLESEPTISVRSYVRFGILIGLLTMPLGIVAVAMMEPGATNPPSSMQIILTVCSSVMSLFAMSACVAGLVHLGRLAGRLKYVTYDRSFRIVAWGYGVSSAMIMPIAMGIQISTLSSGGVPGALPPIAMTYLLPIVLVSCVVSVASLTFMIWAIVLLFKLHFHLRDEHRSILRNRAIA